MLRTILAAFAALLVTTVLSFPSMSAGVWDSRGIAESQLGIPLRQPSRFIEVISSWDGPGLDEDRQRCTNHQMVLRGAVKLFREQKLTDLALESLVEKAGLPPICLMWVSSSEYPEAMYPVLLTVDGDVVFGYDEHVAYTSWYDVNHADALFDTIMLDPWTTLGIAPRGEFKADASSEGRPLILPDAGDVPIPTPRPDPENTGSVN